MVLVGDEEREHVLIFVVTLSPLAARLICLPGKRGMVERGGQGLQRCEVGRGAVDPEGQHSGVELARRAGGHGIGRRRWEAIDVGDTSPVAGR